MLSHAMAHSPGRLTKKTTLHSTATSASRDPTQTAQFSRFLLASGMTGGVYQTLGGAILAGRSRTGNPGVEPQLTIAGALHELARCGPSPRRGFAEEANGSCPTVLAGRAQVFINPPEGPGSDSIGRGA